jgi:hypothetical protein
VSFGRAGPLSRSASSCFQHTLCECCAGWTAAGAEPSQHSQSLCADTHRVLIDGQPPDRPWPGTRLFGPPVRLQDVDCGRGICLDPGWSRAEPRHVGGPYIPVVAARKPVRQSLSPQQSGVGRPVASDALLHGPGRASWGGPTVHSTGLLMSDRLRQDRLKRAI